MFSGMTECVSDTYRCLAPGHTIWSYDASRLTPGQFRQFSGGLVIKTSKGKVIVHHGPYQLVGEKP